MDRSRAEEGIVYLVGAGPGDPGLLTLRGAACLGEADTAVYDYLVNPRILNHLREDCERVYVGKKAGEHSLSQDKINTLLIEKCREGRCVVRLKGGDPFVFGRGGEEALALAKAGCRLEIVPGVTSGIAAPAYAGIPVTHRDRASIVTFVTGHEDPEKAASTIDWETLARVGGTLVFYMGVRNLDTIASSLIGHGLDRRTPAALVRWGTCPTQETLTGTLEDIAAQANASDFKPPAVLVVGDVVALRREIAWFETRPLFGQRILVTRARAQASEFVRRLDALGADVVEFPVMRIAPPEDAEPLRRAAREANGYDWIVFTSVNAVEAFFDAMRAEGLDARSLGGVRICAIGPATAARLEDFGLSADLIPDDYIAEAVAESLIATGEIRGTRILLPRSALGRPHLPETLREHGAQVDEVETYRTLRETPDNADAVRRDLEDGAIRVVTFASSSAVRYFVESLGDDVLRRIPRSARLASIGPETTKTLRSLTDRPIDEARQHTIEGMIQLLIEVLSK
ncbi:uroporphyrinogen-III C-methyltransferase [Candidatus Sumerlaeota bacterium]|nr:uroporphyrinogen-III C-methyltransferase [Candidatus Sumerlaeota bacterium]